MQIKQERIQRAQRLMAQEGMIGLMIMTHDDYRYFFGELRAQPRAIIPVSGPPILIAFVAEEPELRQALEESPVSVFGHIGENALNLRYLIVDFHNPNVWISLSETG